MTIDDAIKLLRDVRKCHCVKELGYYEKAVDLGIEALKRCKERRQRFPNLEHLKLPGETEE